MLDRTMTRTLPAINSEVPIPIDTLKAYAPSVFADRPCKTRSERYGFVPTSDILYALQDEGFNVHGAGQRKSRVEGRHLVTLHRLALRHKSSLLVNRAVEPEVPQIVIMNDHMGRSQFHMYAGLYRFVCANGLVVGDTCAAISVPHNNDALKRVIEGVYTIVDTFDTIRTKSAEMKQLKLTHDQQHELAEGALKIRYPKAVNPPLEPQNLLFARRPEDNEPSLWSTFNRIQENLSKGGVELAHRPGKRRTRTRAITSITLDTRMNRELWDLAENMLDAA